MWAVAPTASTMDLPEVTPDPLDGLLLEVFLGQDMTQELLKAKQALPARLPEILPGNILASNHLIELCRRLIDPDLNRRFPTAAVSIVDREGTYEFSKDLMLAGLAVCNYHEIIQGLGDVKHATREMTHSD